MRKPIVVALRVLAALAALPWLAFAVPFAVGYGLDMAFEGGTRSIEWTRPVARLYASAGVTGSFAWLAALACFGVMAAILWTANRLEEAGPRGN